MDRPRLKTTSLLVLCLMVALTLLGGAETLAQGNPAALSPSGKPNFAASLDVYPAKIRAIVQRHLRPVLLDPETAKQLTAHVSITLSNEGQVVSAVILRPSGHAEFDSAVLEALSAMGTTTDALPLPIDEARRRVVLANGVRFDVRPTVFPVTHPGPVTHPASTPLPRSL
ncbi:MAG: TonB C-terminal domain-containing protein [Myxococcales bacterium]|nr:TonB C-terminal domain-containing protein [Myxococcales bacterium]